ncbi:hypothetical protein FYK55_01730 [Roseiconus nitratireducens]|uniref:Formylmethanofuran dehydrogenase subunit C n=1 Tax=Roseiconus nitratireducens TaxID=2605748 RepID=A0A5M6DHY1_9BACT|nr:hypothetical protein [Roseiconus nitratireducens]KAA5547158.1 hypothetical protein FYK55_01730 [Roseiconus nitratireducens]
MTRWEFRLRRAGPAHIDASSIHRSQLAARDLAQIQRLSLIVDGVPTELGDCFDVRVSPSDSEQIVFEGPLSHVHGLATRHDRGEFLIEGDVGDYLASAATGGVVQLSGSAGDWVGAPLGASRLGINGATVSVRGSVGRYAGHRMRRGCLLVDGDASELLAALMIAGTIAVGGSVGRQPAMGMRRGTILLADADSMVTESGGEASQRFTEPVPFRAGFLQLLNDADFDRVLRKIAGGDELPKAIWRVRCDRSVGGQGELLYPASE